MRKHKHYTPIYLSRLVIAVLLLTSGVCLKAQTDQLKSEDVIGTWLLDYNKSKQTMAENVKKQLSVMETAQRKQVEDSYLDRELVFEEDGVLTILLKDGTNIKANWTLDEISQVITIKDAGGKSRTYTIPECRNDKLVLRVRTNSTQTLPFITEWHLKKQ